MSSENLWGTGGQESPASVVSSTMYESTRVALLSDVLVRARMGTLEADWRTRLTVDQQQTYEPYHDAVELAAQAVLTPEPALWEPGVAGHWRQALDAWYCASLMTLNDGFDLRQQTAGRARRVKVSALVKMYALPLLDDEKRQSLLDKFLASEPLSDFAAANAPAIEVRDRDRLHAWYRASLAVGGQSNDWVSWYRGRIAGWPNREMAARVAANLEEEQFRAEMESPLPEYWQPVPGRRDGHHRDGDTPRG